MQTSIKTGSRQKHVGGKVPCMCPELSVMHPAIMRLAKCLRLPDMSAQASTKRGWT